MAPAKAQDQLALDEQVVEDAALIAALEEREEAKGELGESRKVYREIDVKAKGHLERLGLADGQAFRAGRFRITRTSVPGRTVSFETAPRSRTTIALLDED